jgi:hypothetical protein
MPPAIRHSPLAMPPLNCPVGVLSDEIPFACQSQNENISLTDYSPLNHIDEGSLSS